MEHGKKGAPAKTPAGTSGLFSEGLQLRSRTGSMREQTKEYPAGWKDSGGVCGASITAFPSKKTAIILLKFSNRVLWRTLAGDTRSRTAFVPEAG